MNNGEGAGEPLDRHGAVAELMAAQATAGEDTTTVALLARLCRAAAQYTSALGAAVSLMSESGSVGVVASADQRSFVLDELQFALGEGPSHDAYTRRRPVLIADLQSSDGEAWPIYRGRAIEIGVNAVFAFPLHVGAATFGVLTIYTSGTPRLDAEQLKMALTFAETATEILMDGDPEPQDGSLHPGVEKALSNRTVIYQAQGSVMVQLGVSLSEALVRMRAHAFAHEQSLAELAALIMSGDVVLDSTTIFLD